MPLGPVVDVDAVPCDHWSSSPPRSKHQVGAYFLTNSLWCGAAVPSRSKFSSPPTVHSNLRISCTSPKHMYIFHHGLLVSGGSYGARSGWQLWSPRGDLSLSQTFLACAALTSACAQSLVWEWVNSGSEGPSHNRVKYLSKPGYLFQVW